MIVTKISLMNLVFAGENSDPGLGKSVPCPAEKSSALMLGAQLRVLRSLNLALQPAVVFPGSRNQGLTLSAAEACSRQKDLSVVFSAKRN